MSRRLAATILMFLLHAVTGMAQPVPLQCGDLVLTRNADAIGNPNGYFNHVAIVTEICGTPVVVEMQCEFAGCIAVTQTAFFRRYPEYMIIRHENRVTADRAGKHALAYVGGPRYGMVASLKPFVLLGQNDNCVSLVRKCYRNSGLTDPRWIKPDGVYFLGKSQGFHQIAHFRYTDYVLPLQPFERRIL